MTTMSGCKRGYAGRNYLRSGGSSSGRGRGNDCGGRRGRGGDRGGHRGERGRGGGQWQEPRPSNAPSSSWSPVEEDTKPIPACPPDPVPVSEMEGCFRELVTIQRAKETPPATTPESSKSLRHLWRPVFGTIGSYSIVYFVVKVADPDLHQYHVCLNLLFLGLDIGFLIVLCFLSNSIFIFL